MMKMKWVRALMELANKKAKVDQATYDYYADLFDSYEEELTMYECDRIESWLQIIKPDKDTRP